MSLYSWLSGRERGPYYYHSDADDYSNPQCGINWGPAYEGATFVNINISETKIKDYVLTLLDEKTANMVDEVTERAIEKLKDNINMTVEAAVAQSFIEISEETVQQIIDEEKERES